MQTHVHGMVGASVAAMALVAGVSNVGRRRSGLQRAFLANSSGMTDLGALQGTSVARAVNDFGRAVGASGGASLHAVLWKLN